MDWRTIPSLSALRAFEAMARLGGFSAAARELNVTHSVIAQHVRYLEEYLTVKLAYREGSGPVGALCQRHSKTAFKPLRAAFAR